MTKMSAAPIYGKNTLKIFFLLFRPREINFISWKIIEILIVIYLTFWRRKTAFNFYVMEEISGHCPEWVNLEREN